jgi:xylose isomerase
MEGRIDLVALGERVVEDDVQPAPRSGRQEYLENYVTRMLR